MSTDKATPVEDPTVKRKFPNDMYHHEDDAYREALMHAARNVTILSRRMDDWNYGEYGPQSSGARVLKAHVAVVVALAKVLS